jgi:hypothetical protein
MSDPDITVERDSDEGVVRLIISDADSTVTLSVGRETAAEIGSLMIRQAAALPLTRVPKPQSKLRLIQGGRGA